MYHNLMKETPMPYGFKGGMTSTTGPPYSSLPMAMPQPPQDFSSQVSGYPSSTVCFAMVCRAGLKPIYVLRIGQP